VASSVDWSEETYRMKNDILLSSELCPWDEGGYRGTRIVRVNALLGDMMLDVVKVGASAERTVDLLYHISGELLAIGGPCQGNEYAAHMPYTLPLCELESALFTDALTWGKAIQRQLQWKLQDGRFWQ